MSAVPADVVPAAASAYARRISLNDAALARSRGELADRRARRASTSSSERIIARLEVETTLLQAWAERDARLAADVRPNPAPGAALPAPGLTTEGSR